MPVELLDWMGDDISVVDAARVSFRKKVDRSQSPAMKQEDISLLYYLARHGHWSPFAHPQISFRVSTTIAVARQLMRHNVGLTVNEVSRRYVHTGPEFELPKQWRAFPPDTIKQGSGGVLDDGSHASGIAEKAVREAR